MKTFTFLFLFAILCTTGAKSQKTIKGSGYILTQQREVPVYNSIEVNGPLRIFATPDELRPVIIEADNNLFPYIKTEVRHDTLRMFIDREVYIETFAVMNIFLSIPNISNLKVENGANIDGSRTPWKNKATTIKAYPNTRIKWYIDTPMLNLTAEGNTVITLNGNADTFNLSLEQGALLAASELKTKQATVTISGMSSKATIDVSGSISYDLSQKGRLIYKGTPQILKANISSGAKVNQRK